MGVVDVGSRRAKVDDFEVSFFVDSDVVFLEVSVQDLEEVEKVKSLCELFSNFEVICLILKAFRVKLRVNLFAFGDVL